RDQGPAAADQAEQGGVAQPRERGAQGDGARPGRAVLLGRGVRRGPAERARREVGGGPPLPAWAGPGQRRDRGHAAGEWDRGVLARNYRIMVIYIKFFHCFHTANRPLLLLFWH